MIISDIKPKPANFPCKYMNKEPLEYVNKKQDILVMLYIVHYLMMKILHVKLSHCF